MAMRRAAKDGGETTGTTKADEDYPVAAFLDTNVFYDYNFLDQIKWGEVLGAGRVLLVLAPIVLRELNDHKDGGRKPSLSERAGRVLVLLSRLFERAPNDLLVNIAPGVDLLGEPRDAPAAPPRFNPNEADDQLIANALLYREENPGGRVVLVTSDLGLKLKARHHGVPVVTLPDKYKSPPSQDPRDRKIRALEAALDEMRNRSPLLDLVVNGVAVEPGGEATPHTIVVPRPLSPSDIPALMDEIRRRRPHLVCPPSKPMTVARLRQIAAQEEERARGVADHADHSGTPADDTDAGTGPPAVQKPKPFNVDQLIGEYSERQAMLNEEERQGQQREARLRALTSTQIERYNADLDAFYNDCENYLRRNLSGVNALRRTFTLTAGVVNTGRGPAEDIDVFLNFPRGFAVRILDDDEDADDEDDEDTEGERRWVFGLPLPPKLPEPGEDTWQGRGVFDIASLVLPRARFHSLLALPPAAPRVPPNVSWPTVTDDQTHGPEVHIHVRRIKQKRGVAFERLIVTPSDDACDAFVIEFVINAEQNAEEVEGRVEVSMSRDDVLLPPDISAEDRRNTTPTREPEEKRP
jgi:hypothetical protein